MRGLGCKVVLLSILVQRGLDNALVSNAHFKPIAEMRSISVQQFATS